MGTRAKRPDDKGSPPEKLSIVVYSGAFDRIHYALAMAASAAAVNIDATLFFTMGACRALLPPAPDGTPGWAGLGLSEGAETAFSWTKSALAHDAQLGQRGVARFEELIEACRSLGVTFMVCEMGLRAIGLEMEELRGDIDYREGGLVTFLHDASASGAMVVL